MPVLATKRLSHLCEIRYKVTLEKVVEKYEFRENWLSDRRNLIEGVNGFSSFTHFVSNLVETRCSVCSHNAIEQFRVS